MILRIARHTDNLEAIKTFYTEILDLQLLGGFQDHDGYDGVFIGKSQLNWHLEFTTSSASPKHHFDEDDLLVFYPESLGTYEAILEKIQTQRITVVPAKNPYWNQNGILIKDPDGYGVMISALKITMDSHD
jgi:catechol 2,3-dioxygenase-like lactoylglutathione lyase family enzyme